MKTRAVAVAALLLACAGTSVALELNCSPEDLARAQPQLPATHVVQQGDDLHLISTVYFGHARNWEMIWKANRAVVKNPNRLEPGVSLTIPK